MSSCCSSRFNDNVFVLQCVPRIVFARRPFLLWTLPNTMIVVQAVLVFSFGVTHLVVAVNKIDTVDWDRERYDSVVAEVLGFLLKVNEWPVVVHLHIVGASTLPSPLSGNVKLS